MWVDDNYYVYEENGKLTASLLLCEKPRKQKYWAYIGRPCELREQFIEFKREDIFYYNGDTWEECNAEDVTRVTIAVINAKMSYLEQIKDYMEEFEWRRNLPKLEKTDFPFDNKKRDSCDCCKRKFWTKWYDGCNYELNGRYARVVYTTMGVKVLCHKCVSWYWKHDALPNYER